MPERSREVRISEGAAHRLWTGATVVLLVIAVVRFSTVSFPATVTRATPFDYTPLGDPGLWYFIEQSKTRVPEGATVVVITPGGEQDEVAYFFAVALLTRQRVVPNRYFGAPQSEAYLADYVLAYRDASLDDPELRAVETFAGGTIIVRSR